MIGSITFEIDAVTLTALATVMGAAIMGLVTYRNKKVDERGMSFQGGAVMYDAFTKTLMADNARLREENETLRSAVQECQERLRSSL